MTLLPVTSALIDVKWTFKKRMKSLAMFSGRWPTTVSFPTESVLIIAIAFSSIGLSDSFLQMRDSPIRNENEKDPESEEKIQEIEPEEITSHDALIFIDKLINLKELNDTERST